MTRYSGLLRDTWWFWILLFVAGIVAAMLFSPVFLCTIPIGIFAFIYFGLVRYDNIGKRREGL